MDIPLMPSKLYRWPEAVIRPTWWLMPQPKITHLVVEYRGNLRKPRYLVPIEHVAESIARNDPCWIVAVRNWRNMPVFDKVTSCPRSDRPYCRFVCGLAIFFPETPIIRKEKDHIPGQRTGHPRGAGVEATDGRVGPGGWNS